MMHIIAKLDQQTMQQSLQALQKNGGALPEFAAGDTLRVHVRVKEGERSRVQVFEGICVARHNKGAGSSFTVRKLSFGEGVERVFPLFSPVLDKIEVVRRGDVRRAKLYYLRGLTGKAARIAEKSNPRHANKGLQGAVVADAEAAEAPHMLPTAPDTEVMEGPVSGAMAAPEAAPATAAVEAPAAPAEVDANS